MKIPAWFWKNPLRKQILFLLFSILFVISFLFYTYYNSSTPSFLLPTSGKSEDYIKWVEFNPPYSLLEKALDYDLSTYGTDIHLDWIDLLACTAAKTGGEFSSSSLKTLNSFAERLLSGESIADVSEPLTYFSYYKEAYTAVLGGMVGLYRKTTENPDDPNCPIVEYEYGLKAYSPIAKGYGFSHYDDFGNARSYGYQRQHLGNDLMGSIGTPIVAVEGGIVEALGWNQYGGWRIGIRSFDGQRYYYYAHLRKNHPYHQDLKLGSIVSAGDVIGYLGMTGYSTKENVNNITTPHLHFGLQLIFDESQKEATTEIWVDVYKIVKLLEKHKMPVQKDEETKDYFSLIPTN